MLSSAAQKCFGKSFMLRSNASKILSVRGLSTLAYSSPLSSKNNKIERLTINNTSNAPSSGHVSVKWLAAGIDDLDLVTTGSPINNIGGNEGVGIITNVGSDVKDLQKGDHVIPIKMGLGTWSEESNEINSNDIMRISSNLKLELAGTLPGNSLIAQVLLDTYCKDLKENDVILHTNANDSVGTSLIQLGEQFEIISIVNDKSMDLRDYTSTIERLKLQGSSIAVGCDYLKSSKTIASIIPQPKIIFHGGDDDYELKCLQQALKFDCKIVSYSTSSSSVGGINEHFRLNEWLAKTDRKEIESKIDKLVSLMEEEKLTGWLKRIPFEHLSSSVEHEETNRKLIAMM